MDEYLTILLILAVLLLVFLVISQLKTDKRKMILINKDGTKSELDVEIADNSIKRMRGLMFRSSLPENEGMLFIFDDERIRSFWMMNTTIPLDAIHITSDGQIIDIVEMEPCKSIRCQTYTGQKPAKYVLEVNQGFGKRHNITLNDTFIKIN